MVVGRSDTFHDRQILAEPWSDLCALLDREEMPWSKRFSAIRRRMDQIDITALPHELQCPVVACYRRTVVGALHTPTEPGFEGVLAHWRIGCITPVHGHPPVVMYAALSGKYRMVMYKLTDEGVVPTGETIMAAGDHLFHVGKGDRYDHFIHSVECVEEGWTLNLYSDDARKGLVFRG